MKSIFTSCCLLCATLCFSQSGQQHAFTIDPAQGMSITATGTTSYSGNREIVTDYYNGSYRLRDYTRGNGIITMNLRRFADYNSAVDFTNSNTNWNLSNTELDQFAVDVHWNTEKVYDYFLTKFNRNSIDDKGFALYSFVHYGVDFSNAFWDGSRMSYGDGFKQPLTTLDLCGHEITHGLIQFTSGLSYTGESGALNEGFCDIFGTAIEKFARPDNWDWKIGSEVRTTRDLSDPNHYLQPDTYRGLYWYEGNDQEQYIHRNSSVLSYWFYLLSVGGAGKNDFDVDYIVDALGMEKAAAIAYYTNKNYLFHDAGYMDAVNGSLRAAEMLYGEGSEEAEQTANAWAAVGLVLKPSSPMLSSSAISPCPGTKILLTVDGGNLNSASGWKWYSGNCGENYLGSGDSLEVSPTVNTVYYARGEGHFSGVGPCASIFVVPVTDNIPPSVVAEDTVRECLRSDKKYAVPAILASDECSLNESAISFTISGATTRSGLGKDATGIFNTGTSRVTWRVPDMSGNITEASTQVIITNCSDPWAQWLSNLSNVLVKLQETLEALKIKISAYPNPSHGFFRIVISGNNFKPVTIIVRDNMGRVVETRNCTAGSMQEIGKNYHQGIYFAEVIQGNQRVIVKLLRQ